MPAQGLVIACSSMPAVVAGEFHPCRDRRDDQRCEMARRGGTRCANCGNVAPIHLVPLMRTRSWPAVTVAIVGWHPITSVTTQESDAAKERTGLIERPRFSRTERRRR